MMASLNQSLLGSQRIVGKTLVFRNANVGDAEFILALRTDERKSRYISSTSNDVELQRSWLRGYAGKDDQIYFVIEHQSRAIGTARLYDQRHESFCWGSWVLSNDAPLSAAIESSLMVYAYAVDHLGFKAAHFTVSKGNQSVWKFHERSGAVRTHEDDEQYFYKISIDEIQKYRHRYAKFLPVGVSLRPGQAGQE